MATTVPFIIFLLLKLYLVFQIEVPFWDSSVYLVNARDMLHSESLYEEFRPPVISALIASIWAIVGENLTIVKSLDTIFTMGSAVMLLLILKRQGIDHYIALLSTFLFLTSTQVLLWSDYVLTHACTTFLALLMVFLLFCQKSWKATAMAGVTMSLSFLTRYTTAVILVGILIAWIIRYRKFSHVIILFSGALLPLIIYSISKGMWLHQLLGELVDILFWTAPGPQGVVPPSPLYYAIMFFPTFKIMGLLALAALFERATYADRDFRVWIFWLAPALAFFSLIGNKQLRFTFEWTPAVAALAALASQHVVIIQKPDVKRTAVVLITILSISSAILSINEYLTNYDRYSSTPGIKEVASYLENRTRTFETALSNWDPPTLSYFSGRTVGNMELVGSVQELESVLKWTGSAYVVVAEGYGLFQPSSIQDTDFLHLEQTVQTENLKVYLYRYLGFIKKQPSQSIRTINFYSLPYKYAGTRPLDHAAEDLRRTMRVNGVNLTTPFTLNFTVRSTINLYAPAAVDCDYYGIGHQPGGTVTYTIDISFVSGFRLLPDEIAMFYEAQPQPSESMVTISVVGNGTTDPVSGTHKYPHGSTLYVTARPDAGSKLRIMRRNGVDWTSSNPGEFLNLRGTEKIEVIFEQAPPATVNIAIVGNGTTDPAPGMYTFLYGSKLYITAYPGIGWKLQVMRRNRIDWTSSNPGEFSNLMGTEKIEIIFEEEKSSSVP